MYVARKGTEFQRYIVDAAHDRRREPRDDLVSHIANATFDDLLAALERARMIIDSLLYDPADIAWLDDEMLAGKVGLKEASEIIIEAMKRMTGQGNRAQRRAAAKKAPARRKAPEKATAAPAKKTNGRKRS